MWRAIGHGFAAVAKGAAVAAIWASKHPAVIAQVAAISGNAKAIQIANLGGEVATVINESTK